MHLAEVWLAGAAKFAASPNVPAQTNYLRATLATEIWTIQSEDRHVVRFLCQRIKYVADYKPFLAGGAGFGVRRPAVALLPGYLDHHLTR